MSPTILNESKSILVASPTGDFSDNLLKESKNSPVPFRFAHSGKETQLIIADQKVRIHALILSSKIENPSWISVVRACKMHRINLPIMLLLEENGLNAFSPQEIRQVGITKVLSPPCTYSSIIELIAPKIIYFETEETGKAEAERSKKLEIGEAFDSNSGKYIAIPIEDFCFQSTLGYDVFVRIGKTKFVKIFNANDVVDSERLKEFMKKGVQALYVHEFTQAQYLASCEKLASQQIKNDKVSIQEKLHSHLNFGAETIKYLSGHGLDEKSLAFSRGFVSVTDSLIRTFKDSNEMVYTLYKDLKKYDHAVSTTLVSGLLGNKLNFRSQHLTQIIGLASMLHDVGLLKLPPQLQDEDESNLSADQMAVYQLHPTYSSDILKTIPQIDPVIVQAVSQHHERRTRKGYPSKIGAGGINRVAEIIGISDDYVKLIHSFTQDSTKDDVQKKIQELFDGYSTETTDAFQAVFLNL